MASRELGILLAMIDQAYNRRSWHGTNLRGSLRGLSSEQARWRPGRRRHNIWEIVVHCAYWKYAVTRRLRSEKRGTFPVKGSNWFPRPAEASEAAWRADVRLLDEMHDRLRRAIAGQSPGRVRQTPGDRSTSVLALITGIAAHDLYHAGQIQVLKKLYRGRS